MTTAAPALTPSRADIWRIRALAVLVGLNVVQYVLMLAGIPRFYERIVTGTVPDVYVGGQLTITQASLNLDAAVRGMTPANYAIYFVILQLVIASGFWAAGALVLAKAGGHWYRWLTALFLIFFPSGQLWTITQVSQVNYHILTLNGLLWPIFLLFFYLFPDGRAVPRWSRWPMAGFVGFHFIVQVIGVLAENAGAAVELPDEVKSLFVIVILGLAFALGCQVYRYLRVAGPVERKQVQWFVAALALFVSSGFFYSVVLGKSDLTSADGYLNDFDEVTNLIIPAAITISILRYRLWDIDVIIRRTLVYGLLSGLLALVYFGSIAVLQRAAALVTGENQSTLVTVLSTLLIAALFGPLRGRVQRAIDRRFYRRKYDAARTLAQFGASVRDNVDLDALGDRLTTVVDDTMQPAHLSLWTPAQPQRRPHDASS